MTKLLREEDVRRAIDSLVDTADGKYLTLLKLRDAIAALPSAPITEPAQGEPVARVAVVSMGGGKVAKVLRVIDESSNEGTWIVRVPEGTLLYTAPPSQPTDAERE